jgi:hypothetical protein
MAVKRPVGRRCALFRAAAPGLLVALLSSAASAAPVTDCSSTRARSEIDRVSAAMLAWLTDIISGKLAGNSVVNPPICPETPPVDLSIVPEISHEDLQRLLVPEYIEAVPELDPWGHPYEYRLNVEDLLSPDVLAIRSAGSDGTFGGPAYGYRFTTGPGEDLVSYNDEWVRDVPRFDPVSRQERTVAQLEIAGIAIMTWVTSVPGLSASIPQGRLSPSGPAEVDVNAYTPTTAAQLREWIDPFYISCIPVLDGWDSPIEYRLNPGSDAPPALAIRSFGSDHLAEGDVYPIAPFPADEDHHDLVWADWGFAREPGDARLLIFVDGFESGELWGYWSCGPGF